MELGSLYYDLDAPTDKLDKSLDKADKSVKKFGDETEKTSEKLQQGLNNAAKGFAVAGAGLTLIAKNATDFTVDLVKDSKKLSREIGVSVEEASRLTAALKRVGIETEEASASFGIFSKNIANGSDGFEKIGVKIKDASGKQKDFTTLLLEVADRFKAMPDGVEKTASSMELFGRSGKEMIKVLDLGSQGILDLEKRADELGLTLNEKTIGSVNSLVQSQKDLKESTDNMKIAIGTATAPVLTEFNTTLNDAITSLLGTDGAVKDVTVSVLAFGGPVLAGAAAMLQLTANLVQAWPAITGVATALGGLTALSLAVWGAGIIATFVAVKNSALDTIDALDAAYNAGTSADISNDNAIRSLQKKAAQARAAGNAKEAARIANVITSMTGSNARGTDNWRGGLTWINEKGPELVDLPNGTRIIPHELSKQIVQNDNRGSGGTTINIGTVQDRSDAEYIMRRSDRRRQRTSLGLSPA